MTIDQSAQEMLAGGAPSATFPTIGTSWTGTVIGATTMQQRDFDDDSPLYWDVEKTQPKMQLVITINTAERNPEIPGDNGDRRLFAKGNMRQAVGTAIRSAGRNIEEGGTLTVTYVSDGVAPRKGANPPKQYTATYAPPPAGYKPPSSAPANQDEDPF
jgi:hypothetical protein